MGDAGRKNADWMGLVLARFEKPLLRYASFITRDLERAREVVQDTFLRLCKRNPVPAEDHLPAWLFTVCRRRALDVIEKDRRLVFMEDEAPCSDVQERRPSPVEVLERKESMEQITKILATLPARQQEVIRLKFQNELSYREISEVMEVSVSNVGFLIHRGIATLRQKLAAPSARGSRVLRRVQ